MSLPVTPLSPCLPSAHHTQVILHSLKAASVVSHARKTPRPPPRGAHSCHCAHRPGFSHWSVCLSPPAEQEAFLCGLLIVLISSPAASARSTLHEDVESSPFPRKANKAQRAETARTGRLESDGLRARPPGAHGRRRLAGRVHAAPRGGPAPPGHPAARRCAACRPRHPAALQGPLLPPARLTHPRPGRLPDSAAVRPAHRPLLDGRGRAYRDETSLPPE